MSIAAVATEPVTADDGLGAAGVIPEHELRTLVYNELVNMLYRQLPLSISSTMIVGVIMIFALWHYIPAHWLGVWLILMSANQATRAYLYLRFRAGHLARRTIRWRIRIWTAGAVISGVLWGSTAFFFYTPESAIHQAMLIVLVLGSTTAAVPLIASHMASLYGFLVPALTPFIVRHLMGGGVAHIALGLILLAVTLALLSFGRNYYRLIVASLRNRFENEALAQRFARQNEDLEQARIVAEQASRSKTQFFAAASHDLRQPLHAMGLFASALSQKAHEPDVARLVDSINGSVQALEALFNELLDISKLDSGVVKPNVAPVALDQVFSRLRSGFTAEAAAKQLTLSIAPAPYHIASDAILLERILRNLISNAIRYTAAGEVAVTAELSGQAARISVRDTGIGIRQEDQQRIFDEFVQVGNPGRTSKKGLGLGLSIVQRLCTLLGYSIRIESEFGSGTTFGFEVPLSLAPSAARAEPAPVRSGGDLSGRLIVVIDDETAVIEGMKALLGGWGAQVIVSNTGDDVIEAVHAAERIPDLMIIDYRVGGGDTGIQIAQRLRQALDPEIPAILVTGSVTPDLSEQARAAGLEFMLKPVNAAVLRERIHAVLAAASVQ